MKTNLQLVANQPLPYKLTTKQIQAILMIVNAPSSYEDENGVWRKSKGLEVLLYGGARSAKTFLNCYIVILRALKERSRHIILRESFTSLDQSILHDAWPKVMFNSIPDFAGKVRHDESHFFVTLLIKTTN
ncbi:hypothetical protein AGMMS49593_02220 [Endomicrobiia bacterium]|nr:hypothetical protein AGMMS49593_02220 [Endomicrobiia bacterium]